MYYSPLLQASFSGIPKPSQCRDTSFVKKIVTIINDHLSDEQFGVPALAAAAHISTTQLNRRLKKLLQCTPAALIRQLRMEHAASLLRQNNEAVGAIAFTVGYANQANFCRSFKRHYGCSPKVYINQFGQTFSRMAESDKNMVGNDKNGLWEGHTFVL